VIGNPILIETEGREHFFHGMGREDIDARMLGTGRPFVLEISEPKRRDIDLGKMQSMLTSSTEGLADAVDLRFSSREEVRRVKMDDPEKVYLAHIAVHGKVNKEKVNEVVHTFKHRRISQQTPVRVIHRRADLDREKEIIDIAVESFDDDVLVLRLRTQSGTYIKEFVSGDGGRTKPNLSEELGVPCVVTALDVVEIIDITEV
jgi:tRNA pseudouridine synthase 10